MNLHTDGFSTAMDDVWQKNASFSNTNLRMLKDEILCDVTFLAGKDGQMVKAHKYMLASRSSVFYAMFCGHMAERSDQISVPDIEAETLRELLRFMYTERLIITPDTIWSLMYAAHKYDITTLYAECRKFLTKNLTPENVCFVLPQALAFDDDELLRHCHRIISKNTEDVLDSDAFLTLAPNCLQNLLGLEELCALEELVFKACVKWAQEQCKRNGNDVNDARCREALGNILYLIRFPCMTPENFKALVAETEILSPEERLDVAQHLRSKDKQSVYFSSKRRCKGWTVTINRFDKMVKSTWNNGKSTDSLKFSCSEEATLLGVGIYDSFKCKLQIVENKTVLHATEVPCCFMPDGIVEVRFEEPLKLKKNTTYEIVQTNYRAVPQYGIGGKSTATVDGLTVTFSPNSTHTNETKGQFPRFVFVL